MLKHILILFLSLVSTLGLAQDYTSFKDSISNLSLFTLDELTVDLEFANDTLRANIVANQLIHLAAKEDDYDYIARAYFTKSTLEKSLEIRTKYVDSMMFFTKVGNHEYLLSDAYFQKGEVNFLMGNYEVSMENLAEAYAQALLDGNKDQQLLVETYMAAIKDILGRYYEANQILISSYKHYNKLKFKDVENKNAFLAVIYNLTLSNIYLRQPDSTLFYVQKGKLCLKDLDYPEYNNLFLRSEGIANFGLSNYQIALKFLRNSLKGLSKHDLAESHFYMGECYNGLGNEDVAVAYYIKADSILKTHEARPFEDMTLAYKRLYRYFAVKEETEKAELHLNNFFLLDSTLAVKKQSVGEKLHTLYSLPRVKSEQQKVLKKKILNRNIITVLVVIIIVVFILLMLQRKKLKKQRANAKNIIQQETKQVLQPLATHKVTKKLLEDRVFREILEKLKEFEDDRGFLDGLVNINNLSNRLGTNTTYLSKFMNQRMGIGFSQYLKAIRINYALNMLKEKPELLKYSMNGLASEFGFNNADTFSRAFKEIAKTSPSIYVKELVNRNIISDNL